MSDLFTHDQSSVALASKTSRFFAILIDYVLCLGFTVLYMMEFGEKYTPEGGGVGYHIEGLPTLGIFIIWFVIIVLPEGLSGQSIGKRIAGIKTLKQDENKASIGTIIVRHLLDPVDFFPFFGIVGFLVASNNTLKQRVGDLVAKTIIVKG
jgi:uncharacterized RDD family membrane protein YckC